MSEQLKHCPTCKVEKSESEFHKNSHNSGGLAWDCKTCVSARKKKEWREKPEQARARNRKFWYGLDEDMFQCVLADQNSRCAICEKEFYLGPTHAGKRQDQPHVDHCHVTGKLRGLLCGSCNIGIGNLNDSLELLLKAARYIQKFSPSTIPL